LSDYTLKETLALVEKNDGNITAAAVEAGINRSTFESRYRWARAVLEISDNVDSDFHEDIKLPEFPDETISTPEIIKNLKRRWEQKQEHEAAQRWFDIKVISDDCYGLVVVGDPHLGTHTNWSLLEHDVEIMSTTPGLGCLNIGDTVNNWSSRLIALYADEDISRKTERQLARWFLQEANIPWLLWLHGNHDTMHSEFSTYLKTVNVQQIPMVDWQAKFKLAFLSATIRVDAADNHNGTSIYNPLHGQIRADLWGEEADIFVAGHHHTWAIQQQENAGGHCVTYARARGYKWHHDYSLTHQFNE